jgi:hypothetical protein
MVEGFLVGVEALYIRVDLRGRFAIPVADATGAPTGTFSAT